jgi:dipeptidyl aminopeptidase/acylaminoacyl peptidase
METQEYAPSRLADLYGDVSQPTVLLWHGMQTDARAAVRPLAEALAERRLHVVVPDWNSHAADGGRADLLNSVDFSRQLNSTAAGPVLVGWSMGGVAAAGLTLHAKDFGVSPAHTVCLGGAFMARDPISGGHVHAALDALASAHVGGPFTLLHGVRDDVVPLSASREFAASLERVGWPVDVVELDTDHGAIAGARYDAAADRYDPADDAQTHAVVADVANRIAAAAHPLREKT